MTKKAKKNHNKVHNISKKRKHKGSFEIQGS